MMTKECFKTMLSCSVEFFLVKNLQFCFAFHHHFLVYRRGMCCCLTPKQKLYNKFYYLGVRLPLVKISPLKCLWMMTSSDTADLKKIVKISITNIFISPLIIVDDILQIVLLIYLSWTIFPGEERREERCAVRPVGVLDDN